jgi:regulator of sigma E protease
LGAPQAIEDNVGSKNSKVQITQVVLKSPAEEIGLQVGDEIVMCKNQAKVCNKKFMGVSAVKDFISQNKGQEIILEIKRGAQILEIKGVPRTDHPSDEGALGISLVKTAIISYPVHEAFVRGAITTYDLFITIIVTIAGVVKNLFVGEKIGLDISGPVGIAILSKQVTELGLVYILQFMALLSINLAIINGLPFPALDGGRILFILIEKIKGTPVTQKIEQMIHTVGFFLLISLMVVITFRDLMKIDIIGKIKGIF